MIFGQYPGKLWWGTWLGSFLAHSCPDCKNNLGMGLRISVSFVNYLFVGAFCFALQNTYLTLILELIKCRKKNFKWKADRKIKSHLKLIYLPVQTFTLGWQNIAGFVWLSCNSVHCITEFTHWEHHFLLSRWVIFVCTLG